MSTNPTNNGAPNTTPPSNPATTPTGATPAAPGAMTQVIKAQENRKSAKLIFVLPILSIGAMWTAYKACSHMGPSDATTTVATLASTPPTSAVAQNAAQPTASVAPPQTTVITPPVNNVPEPEEEEETLEQCVAHNPLPSGFVCPPGRTCIAATCRDEGEVCDDEHINNDVHCVERLRANELGNERSRGYYAGTFNRLSSGRYDLSNGVYIYTP